jgi:uncharacterized protein (DUF1684 family)
MTDLSEFRRQKNDFFANSPDSPLTSEQQEKFAGLRYFPEAPELCFKLEIDEFDEKVKVQIMTTSDDIRLYVRFGLVHFEVNGEPASLTVYQTPHGFFIPFADSLAGKETYGAGRYLDPEILPDGKLDVDFNLAYNPYCAYNDLYSCPLTPAENRLKIPIRAGEMSFK